MAKADDQDFFEKAGGFLDAFQKVIENGFFAAMKASVDDLQVPGFNTINITARGYIPDIKTEMPVGVLTFIDPKQIVDRIRSLVCQEGFKFIYRSCDVKTGDYPRYVSRWIGSHGLQYDFSLTVHLKRKRRTNK
jgi:hypothetical protein